MDLMCEVGCNAPRVDCRRFCAECMRVWFTSTPRQRKTFLTDRRLSLSGAGMVNAVHGAGWDKSVTYKAVARAEKRERYARRG
jgi:hypothetical protein